MKYIIYTLLSALLFIQCNAQDLLPFHTDTLWGYKTRQGVVKIEPQYQYTSGFWKGLAIAVKNNKAGIIDSNNRVIMPFHYEFIQPLYDSTEFVFGHRAKYFGEHIVGVTTRDEKIKIPAEYHSITKYNGTYDVVIQNDSVLGRSGISDIRSVRDIHGLLDSNGKVLIPCKYDRLNWLNDSLLAVDTSHISDDGVDRVATSALFNKKGDQLTEFEFMVIGKFSDGLSVVRIGNKCGFIYPSGKVAIPIQFESCSSFNKGYAIIGEQKKWGAIDTTGKIVIEPKFEYQEVKNILKEKYGW